MNQTGLCVRAYGNISEVAGPLFWVINCSEILVEEVVEAFVNLICLIQKNCVAFGD